MFVLEGLLAGLAWPGLLRLCLWTQSPLTDAVLLPQLYAWLWLEGRGPHSWVTPLQTPSPTYTRSRGCLGPEA